MNIQNGYYHWKIVDILKIPKSKVLSLFEMFGNTQVLLKTKDWPTYIFTTTR